MLADDDWEGIREARMEGLGTFFGNPASPHGERHLDLTGIGRLLALSTHRERNSLACVHYRQEFGRDKVYRLRNLTPQENTDRLALSGNLLAPPLFDEEMTHGRFAEMLGTGLAHQVDPAQRHLRLAALHRAIRLEYRVDVRRGGEAAALRVASTKRELEPKPGWIR